MTTQLRTSPRALASAVYISQKPDVTLPFVSTLSRRGVATRFLRLPKPHPMINGLTQALRTRDDLVITESALYSFYYYTKSLMRLSRNDCVVRLNGDPFAEMSVATSPVLSPVYSRGLDFARGVIYVSDHLRARLAPRIKRPRSFVVHNGVDLERFTPLGGDRELFESMIGSRSRSVNVISSMNFGIDKKVRVLPLVVEPLKRITKEFDCAFFFAGSGRRRAWVEKLFSAATNVHFLGAVEHSLLPKLVPQFDVFFHPSGLDALPSSVLEASACGVPILSTSVGGIPEEVEDGETGLLMSDLQEQFYGEMKRLIESGSLRRRLGGGGRRKMEREFNWGVLSDSFADAIAEILSTART